MDLTLAVGNNLWKFHDDMMMGTQSEMCDGRTDGRKDRRTENSIHRAAWLELNVLKSHHKRKKKKHSAIIPITPPANVYGATTLPVFAAQFDTKYCEQTYLKTLNLLNACQIYFSSV